MRIRELQWIGSRIYFYDLFGHSLLIVDHQVDYNRLYYQYELCCHYSQLGYQGSAFNACKSGIYQNGPKWTKIYQRTWFSLKNFCIYSVFLGYFINIMNRIFSSGIAFHRYGFFMKELRGAPQGAIICPDIFKNYCRIQLSKGQNKI